jgi:hemerythrin
MALQWTSALAIGAADLDARHEELFRRVERLHDAMLAHDRTEVARLLEFLLVYVREHFEAEEALMRRIGFPLVEEHAAEHAAFAADVAQLYEALGRDGLTARLVLAVDRRVTGWITDHVYTSDLALGRFSAGRGGARGTRAPSGDA